jgi:O-antigen/teichoic acid export membrane protein
MPAKLTRGRKIATLWNMGFRIANFLLLIARNFAVVPLALRYVGTYEYSTWLAGGSLISQLTTLDFGLSGVVQQQAAQAHGARDRDRLERVVGTGLLAIAGLSCCIGIAGSIMAALLPSVLRIKAEVAGPFSNTFIAASVASGFQTVTFAMAGVLTGMQRPIAAGATRAGADVLSLALTVVLMVHGYGLASIGAGIFVRALLEFVATVLVFRRIWSIENGLEARIDRDTLLPLFRLSIAQFFSHVAGRLKSSLDPLIIGAVLGVDFAANYALTTRAHEAVRALLMQVVGALGPAMAHLFGERSVPRLREVSMGAYRITAFVASIGMGAVILFNESFVAMWVGQVHYAGNAVTIAAAVWGLLSLMGGVTYDQMCSVGEFKKTAMYVWSELAVRLPVLVTGILTLGVVAIPLSSVVSQAIVFNWRMTGALFVILNFPKGSLGSLHGLFVRHALFPLALGTLGLWMGLVWSTWTSLAMGGALFVVTTAMASYAADPYLRSAIRRRTI